MSWLKLVFSSSRLEAEKLEDALMACGALTVSLEDAGDQPLLEPGVGERPLWDKVTLAALFDPVTDAPEVLARLEGYEGIGNADLVSEEMLEDRDWSRVWMDRFKPMRFGNRLWICPSWSEPEDTQAVNLMLDPGLAFGTGTHPTTALCLSWLDARLETSWRVLDYGCGSGVLALAAALLGAGEVVAVDNDPQAITATRENASLNNVEHLVNAMDVQCFLASESGVFDLVVANILAGPLLELAPLLCSQLKPGGHIVLSGILEEQYSGVSAAYSGFCTLEAPEEKDGWILLKGQRFA